MLNSFFSNVVKHLKIPEFRDANISAEYTLHPALKTITKFGNHPSVSTTRNAFSLQ